MLSIQGKRIFLPVGVGDDSIVAGVTVMSIIVTRMLGDAAMLCGPYVFLGGLLKLLLFSDI